MNQTINQTLSKAVEFHKAGHIQKANHLYTAILKDQPKNPDANHNMGVLAVGIGKIKKALPFFQVALEANPNISQFWLSYIDALRKLDKIDEAKVIFNQAKERGFKGQTFDMLKQELDSVVPNTNIASKNQNPPQDKVQSVIDQYSKGKFQKTLDQASQLLHQFPSSIILYNIIGASNQILGQFDAAIEAYKKALVIKPDYADAYNNLGVVLKEKGKIGEAINAYKKALAIKPDYAEAYNNIGNAFRKKGELGEAIKAYKKALDIKPDYADACNNLGLALKEKGKIGEAINAYNKAIIIKPDYPEAYHNISNALEELTFTQPNTSLQKLITLLLDKKSYIRPRVIARGAISLLKFEPNVNKHLQKLSFDELTAPPDEVVAELSKLPLLLKIMSVCPLPDPELENLFVKLRASLLLAISSLKDSPGILKFQSSLALQCYTNEYIYSQSQNEGKALEILEEKVKQALSIGEQPRPQHILCLTSYKALNQYEWCDLVTNNSDIQDVFTRQVIEPRKEKNLRSDIPVLKEITDKVSSKVRQQYESHPYPRWVDTALSIKPAPISRVINELQLKLFHPTINKVKFPEILIAGCGTGQHSIGTASRFKGSKVLAIDLSLSSLAYAKRKTDELGIQNIDYMQADILDLVKLDKKFDIIESSGVLHHMNDPMTGWSALTECLKPGGLMKIGLYSELARQHIIEIREEITQSGSGSSTTEMQSFRTMVMQSNKNRHKTILNFSDFYSLSELKDLLFHVQEHRFSILKIKNCLGELGLKFCGFGTNKIVQNFKLTNPNKEDPYNLDKWQTYEEANPKIFVGMYQFWCQKEQSP